MKKILKALCLIAIFSITLLTSYVKISEAASYVKFKDAAMEKVIREAINKPNGKITETDLKKITKLETGGVGIVSLEDLKYLTNLKSLIIKGNKVSDLSPIAGLKNLTYLDLYLNNITDISPLAKLTKLEYLSLYKNHITNITPLKNLKNLKYLYMCDNNVKDISPVAGLTKLVELSFGSSFELSDISPLKNLKSLTYLKLDRTSVTDISVLKGMTKLTYLYLKYDAIKDFSPIEGIYPRLTDKDFELDGNKLVDVVPDETDVETYFVIGSSTYRYKGKEYQLEAMVFEADIFEYYIPMKALLKAVGISEKDYKIDTKASTLTIKKGETDYVWDYGKGELILNKVRYKTAGYALLKKNNCIFIPEAVISGCFGYVIRAVSDGSNTLTVITDKEAKVALEPVIKSEEYVRFVNDHDVAIWNYSDTANTVHPYVTSIKSNYWYIECSWEWYFTTQITKPDLICVTDPDTHEVYYYTPESRGWEDNPAAKEYNFAQDITSNLESLYRDIEKIKLNIN